MRLWTMVSRNLRVRRMRTALTLLGIAVGMMAIVTLMGLARGFENNWDQTLNARGTDVVVNRISTGSPIPAPFSEEVAREISALPGIEDCGGGLGILLPVESLPMILVTCWEWESYIWNHLEIVARKTGSRCENPQTVPLHPNLLHPLCLVTLVPNHPHLPFL